MRRIFAQISPNLPEKTPMKMTSKNARKILQNSDLHKKKKSSSCQFGRHHFQSKHAGRHFCSDFQGVLEGSQKFFPDFRAFYPDIHLIKNFGGAVSSPASPPPTPVAGGIPAFSCRSGTFSMPTSTIFGGETMFSFEHIKIFRKITSSFHGARWAWE